MKRPVIMKWTGRWAALGVFAVGGALAPWTLRPGGNADGENVAAAVQADERAEEAPVLVEEPALPPEPEAEEVLEAVDGEATFYADRFEGRTTASGAPFRQNGMTAAHRTYPFGTLLRVTNLRNDRSVDVRVTDRGPFGARAEARGTIIDLSRRAARDLDFIRAGRTPVRVEVLEWGEAGRRTG